MQLTAVYSPQLQQCAITETNNTLLAATFIYTMSFDFVTLILTGVRLISGNGHSRLVNLIFNDGLIYFVIAFVSCSLMLMSRSIWVSFLANLVATVPFAWPSSIILFLTGLPQTFMLLNLNAIMSVIANVPAATAATVCCSWPFDRFRTYGYTCRS